MALDVFMKLFRNGAPIPGESPDPEFVKCVELTSFSLDTEANLKNTVRVLEANQMMADVAGGQPVGATEERFKTLMERKKQGEKVKAEMQDWSANLSDNRKWLDSVDKDNV